MTVSRDVAVECFGDESSCMGAPIQMQVYSDHEEIWNEGGLSEGYTAETLMRKHSSRPRNKTIAAVMFRAEFIETWGRGYTKVRESFEADDYPMPVVTNQPSQH